MRLSPLVFVLLAFLGVGACQCLQPVREVPCGKWNCAGCCDPTGSCLAGTALTACGAEASACKACIGNQACTTPAGICRDTSCNGCITQDGGCLGGSANDACGSGGVTCDVCSPTGRCALQRCLFPDGGTGGGSGGAGGTGGSGGSGGSGGGGAGGGGGTGLCGPNTCPGCCNGNTCVTPPTSQRCGINGAVCQTCTNQQVCGANGRCQPRPPDGGVCGVGNCLGCCFNNQCFPGNQSFACGLAGSQCSLCSSGMVCSQGACVRPSDGGQPVGGACTFSAECLASTFAFCLPDNAGWPQGYCSQVCMAQGLDGGCPNSVCVPSTFSSSALVCLASCRADGGQGNCRTNYVCQPRTLPDGTTPATCQPRCSATNPCTGNQVCGDAGVCR